MDPGRKKTLRAIIVIDSFSKNGPDVERRRRKKLRRLEVPLVYFPRLVPFESVVGCAKKILCELKKDVKKILAMLNEAVVTLKLRRFCTRIHY